nr:alkane hydroxylase MAH1-like [Tanacetum cinerariifolium]
MFDIFGDGILNSDNELWEIHRKTTMSLLKHADFQTLLEKTIVNKVENGLLPILESVSTRNQEIDLQEIFQRHSQTQKKLFYGDMFCQKNLMIAGRDTTSMALSWFFYLLAQNPCVESKIRAEICEKWGVKELDKLIYLHGGICEALRLYPPVALEHKAPLKADVLPSGHVIDANTKIILCFYSMGRMEDIWGEDCMEFC